ncbi:MAG: hypothetical protein OXH11_04135 [Candidatus Aminicenantes bacterium]|nr:hypothetical protein [Candidatus Aminicenantes bacterium]
MSITTPRGLVRFILPGAVLFAGLTACATRSDWAAVQGLRAKNITEVQLHKDTAPQGNRKIKGRLDSVTDDSITLRLKDGQRHTFEKQDIHRVLTRRPFRKRTVLLGTLGSVAGYLLGTAIWGNDSGHGPFFYYALPMSFGVSALAQLPMLKIYEAAHYPKIPRGDRQAGTSND